MKQKENFLEAESSGKNTDAIVKESESRDRLIVRASIIGIITNVFLAVLKMIIGIVSHSIAITMDAVNNISDAGSSVITIIGTKLAGKPADKKHPFGYGRIEYFSALIISLIVLYAGITSLTESVKAILSPETPDYKPLSLIIVAIGVLVKFLLSEFVLRSGRKANSDSLIGSGKEARLDAVVSLATLFAALLYTLTKISIEAYLAAVISLIIVKSGADMLKDTISQILGERADPSLTLEIKKTVLKFPEIHGAYDLILNNYGPDNYNGSIHIEVDDTLSASEIDVLLRRVQLKVYEVHKVVLTAIGIYSKNTKDDEYTEVEKKLRKLVMAQKYVRQIHGFYYNKEDNILRFDMVLSFDSPNRKKSYEEIRDLVQKEFPDQRLMIALDMDYSEL